jgi:hypothetical protein
MAIPFAATSARIVELCNDAPRLKAEVERLTKELEEERGYRKLVERDMQKLRRKSYAYKTIDDLYNALKRHAENDAQESFDEHFRDCLYGLQAIAADREACNCMARGWHGDGHDTKCPIAVATTASERSNAALSEGLKAANPHYADRKGGAA